MQLPFSVRRLLGRAVLALSLAAVCASTPAPVPDSVTIVGTFQSELGCSGDWEPACTQTHLARNPVDGVWRSYFVMPEGFHEFKAAINDSWTENYGANATRDGGNIGFAASAGLVVKFFYDPNTHWVTSSSTTGIAVAVGTFQKALGCTEDWQPDCMLSWLTDEDGDAVHRFKTTAIPAGPHRVKVAHNETWEVNYGAEGVENGEDIHFTVPAEGQEASLIYNPFTHRLLIQVAAPTRTTLTAEPGSAMVGDTVTLTAHVEVTEGTAIPTGTVTFRSGDQVLGDVPLDPASGTAIFLDVANATGTVSFTATYNGMYLPSTSEPRTVVIAPHLTTTLQVAPSPALPGQTVTLTAKVAATDPDEPRPTGSITFKAGSEPLGTVALDAEGQAIFSQAFSAGTYALTAEYSGDSRFHPLASSAHTLQVGKAASTVELSSSASPAAHGQSVTFTAQVRALDAGAGSPTGRVLFKNGSVELGEVALDASGLAALSLSTLAVGTHELTASYSGDEWTEGSTSAVLSQQVAQAASRTTLTASKDTAVHGEAVTFTATVEAVAPGAGLPTGDITFRDGDTVLGTASLASGSATFTTSRLQVAPHAVSAEYSGDEGFQGSTAEAVTVTVGRGATSTSLTASPNPSTVEQTVTLSVGVSGVAPASGTPSGQVTFKDGTTVLGSSALDASGEARLSTSALAVGTHTLTAEYTGDASFSGSVSPPVSQTVNALEVPDAGTPTDGGTSTEPDAGTMEPDGGTTTEPDAGTQPGSDAGTPPGNNPGNGPQGGNSGCGCGATDGASAGSLLLVVWMGLSLLRRRAWHHG